MIKVAFQGERGAYSEAAAIAYFGAQLEPVACTTFDDVFNRVLSGDCENGIVPIENTLAGSIHRNYDLLQRHPLAIIGEKIFRVRHCLVAHPGVVLADIRKIISHPQALAQCEGYITRLGVAHEPWYDTAGAVKSLSEGGQRDHAAIASRRAAEVYQMHILAADIEDDDANYTRFLVLARDGQRPGGSAVKTSIVFSLPRGGTTPGALFRALAVFALRDINLNKIESRPIAGQTFQYVFYLDFDGSHESEPCARALAHLREMTPDLRVLGSYPRDENW